MGWRDPEGSAVRSKLDNYQPAPLGLELQSAAVAPFDLEGSTRNAAQKCLDVDQIVRLRRLDPRRPDGAVAIERPGHLEIGPHFERELNAMDSGADDHSVGIGLPNLHRIQLNEKAALRNVPDLSKSRATPA